MSRTQGYNDRALGAALKLIGGEALVTIVAAAYNAINMAEQVGFHEGFAEAHAEAVSEGVAQAFYDQAEADAQDDAEIAQEIEAFAEANPENTFGTVVDADAYAREWEDGYLEGVKDARACPQEADAVLEEIDESHDLDLSRWDIGYKDGVEDVRDGMDWVDSIVRAILEARQDAVSDEELAVTRAALALDETLA